MAGIEHDEQIGYHDTRIFPPLADTGEDEEAWRDEPPAEIDMPEEASRYLAAVDLFRALGCTPRWAS